MKLGTWEAVDAENCPQQMVLSRTGSGFSAGQHKQESALNEGDAR
jgi:hypothetical protein